MKTIFTVLLALSFSAVTSAQITLREVRTASNRDVTVKGLDL